MKKYGFLGPKGTFSESALKKYFEKHNVKGKCLPAHSLLELFELFHQKQCDEIIVPLENSVEGSVNITMDLLIKYEDIYIKEEFILPIQQCLITDEGIDPKSITDIFSHPQPLAQCANYLYENYPNAQLHPTSSTAMAFPLIEQKKLSAEENHVFGVIGNEELATIHHKQITKKNIQDQPNNATRFGILSFEHARSTGNDKTSIIFTAQDKPGSLYEIMGEFAKRNINLTKIESRPSKIKLGEYKFFIDLEGHIEDPIVNEALNTIKNKCHHYRFLGSYRRDNC